MAASLRGIAEVWQSTSVKSDEYSIAGDKPQATNELASDAAPTRPHSKLAFGIAIFASAFLLFQIQPMIAKFILPLFGGVAAVWAVCLLFFQAVLLLGYLYAHLLARRIPPRLQGWVHAALLAISFLALPIVPRISRVPAAIHDPAFRILILLGVTIGLPYFLLSSTSPLLQAWYAQSRPGASPYRLYSLSNFGSMLALLSYPVAMEPYFSNTHQARAWSIAYALAAALCAAIAIFASKGRGNESPADAMLKAPAPPGWGVQTLWVALPACGSALLLAITNHISQNIAAVPLLWIVPLSIYLLSFIITFENSRWYHRNFFLRFLGLALASMAYALSPSFADIPLKIQIVLFCAGLFACCMFCHGELARLKPHPAYLTRFYLLISLGGAIGAVFVAILAPRIFSWYYELEIALGACAVLVLIVHHRDPESPFYRARLQPAWLVVTGLAIILIASLGVTAREQAATASLTVRNFYGVLRVVDERGPNVVFEQGDSPEQMDEDLRFRKLMNGTIDHGLQFLALNRRRWPTTYYGPSSGVGIALRVAGTQGPLRVGLIGLGAGTLAAYSGPGDRYTFYEINPLVVKIAQTEFTFLKDSPANINIVLGDARLSLEQEQPQHFNILAVDAFSGDSIPIHLLTLQAFKLYFRHLAPDGVLAVHISNKFVNLEPVAAAAATALQKEAVLVNFGSGSNLDGTYAATWVLVGSPDGFIAQGAIEKAGKILPPAPRRELWTDDYSSIFRTLK